MHSLLIPRTGWRGVAQGVLVPLPAAAVLSLLAVAVAPPEGPVAMPNARWFFAMVVFAPLAETFLLAFPMLAAMRFIRQGWLAAIAGSVPIILTHATNSWQNVLGAAPMFLWSAWVFVQGRLNQEPWWPLMGRLMAIHAVWNLLMFTVLWTLGAVVPGA